MTTTLDNGNVKMYDAKTEELISPVTKVLCYGVILLAALCILSLSVFGLVLGFILLGAALLFLTTTKRVSIDFENSVYREYTSTFGVKVGEWKKMFDVKTITITSSGKVFSNNVAMGGAQTYSSSSKFNLNLKKDNYKKIVIANASYDEVVKKAKEVSALLNGVDIMDYTKKPAVVIR
ncbi:MAG: hypothetical protein K0R51_1583 [Cytophagaceae bacterium]|jgi:hypothetical protein|nr:hypothetical protein [Cytophagaceae bacterium]